jgi:toxin YoeB
MLKHSFHEILSKQDRKWITSNPQTVLKIDVLIFDVLEHPETGLGHPKCLNWQGGTVWWRKINKKNRLLYGILCDCIFFKLRRLLWRPLAYDRVRDRDSPIIKIETDRKSFIKIGNMAPNRGKFIFKPSTVVLDTVELRPIEQ